MTQATMTQTRSELQGPDLTRDVLLTCGILASLLYIVADIVVAMQWEGYSYASQTVSELMAIGAPTRPFLVPPFAAFDALVIAFGTGVLGAAGQKRSLRFAGTLLVGYGFAGLAGLLLFPMHLRGANGSLTDVMHVIVTCVIVFGTLLFIGFGAAAGGKWFRLYSIATILILLAFGAWAGADGSRMAANLPTPWLGVKERINIYSSMLWMLMLAVVLLRSNKASGLTAASND